MDPRLAVGSSEGWEVRRAPTVVAGSMGDTRGSWPGSEGGGQVGRRPWSRDSEGLDLGQLLWVSVTGLALW